MEVIVRKVIVSFIILILLSAMSVFGYIMYNNSKSEPTISDNTITEIKPLPKEIDYGIAPYTGEKLTKSNVNNIPLMAVVENSPDARPQSGLVDADILFETMAEGGIPRFLALFHSKTPEKIGPVRSVRTYFIDISKEFKLPFAHCGGNEDALQQIKKENLMSMNEIAYGDYFYRDKSRYAPHNLYTSYESLSKFVTDKNYVKKPTNTHFSYNRDYYNNNSLITANSVYIQPNASYNTSYEYKDGKYYKSMDGKPSNDLERKIQVSARNIIIQYAAMKLKNDVDSGIDIKLTGSGKGIIVSGGKFVNVTWSRSSVSGATIFKDEHGNTVPLTPGNTIWHIIDDKTKVNIS